MRAPACALLLILLSSTVHGQETTLSASPAIVKPKASVTVTAVSSRPTPPGTKFRVSNATLLSTEKVSTTTWLLSIGTTDPGLILIDCEHQDFLVGRTSIICAAQDPAAALRALAALVGLQQPEARLVAQMQAALAGIVEAVVGNNIARARGQADRLAHLLITMPHHLLRHALLTPEANVLLASVFEFLIQLPFFQVPGPGFCPLAIERIWFNWQPGHSSDALELRRSYTTEIKHGYLLPDSSEWFIGLSKHAESPAAYAISTTKGRTLQIWARFRGRPLTTVVVRALDTKGVFANVLERTFPIGPDGSALVLFNLGPHRFSDIERKDLEWNWHYRCIPQDIGFKGILNPITRHRIYVTLQPPQAPWRVDTPDVRDNPWTDALDVAIVKGKTRGLSTPQDAAKALTGAIHDEFPFSYDLKAQQGARFFLNTDGTANRMGGRVIGTATLSPVAPVRRQVFTVTGFTLAPIFDLTSVIADVNRPPGPRTAIQCFDLSATLTSLATVVGADMKSHLMIPAGYIQSLYIIGDDRKSNNFFRDSGTQDTPPGYERYDRAGNVTRSGGPRKILPGRELPFGSTIDAGRSYYLSHAFNALGERIYDSQFALRRNNLHLVNLTEDDYIGYLIEKINDEQDLTQSMSGVRRFVNRNATFKLR